MTSVADTKARIEAILSDIPGINLIMSESTRLITALPAAEVVVRGATRQTIDSDRARVTRQFEIYLYVSLIGQPDNDAVFVDALEDCYPWIDTIADYFMARPRLERNDSGIVFGMNDISDSGALPAPYRDKIYAAVRWTIPIIDYRD